VDAPALAALTSGSWPDISFAAKRAPSNCLRRLTMAMANSAKASGPIFAPQAA
jgi:hypothetical protein